MVSVSCIYDEGSMVDTMLIGAKGFSVLIEADGKRIMLDTGLRDRYLVNNMEFMEIDPDSIDVLAISQATPDNCRAINGLIEARTKPLEVYAPAGLYAGKKGFLSSQVGLTEENRAKVVLHDTGDWIELADGVWLSPQVGGESFMAVRGKRTALISARGASGPGPLLAAYRERFGSDPKVFIGSVVLEKRKKPVAEAYAADFEAYGTPEMHLNHSTGYDGIGHLRAHFGLNAIREFYAGMRLEL